MRFSQPTYLAPLAETCASPPDPEGMVTGWEPLRKKSLRGATRPVVSPTLSSVNGLCGGGDKGKASWRDSNTGTLPVVVAPATAYERKCARLDYELVHNAHKALSLDASEENVNHQCI